MKSFAIILFGMANNAIQYNQQKKLMQKQYEYQKQMYDYTFDKQNQYNLPSEQLARMKQAGLNPNLAYGQIQAAGSSGVTGSVPNASPPPLNAHQVDLASMVQADSQRSLSNTQKDLNKSQEDYNKAETQGKIIENAFKARQYGGENGARLASALLKTAENQADYWEYSAEHKSVEVSLANQQISESLARENVFNKQASLLVLQGITEGLRPGLIRKQIEDYDSQITQRQFSCKYLKAVVELVSLQSDNQRIKNQFEFSRNYNEVSILSQDASKRTVLTNAQIDELNSRVAEAYATSGSLTWDALLNIVDIVLGKTKSKRVGFK